MLQKVQNVLQNRLQQAYGFDKKLHFSVLLNFRCGIFNDKNLAQVTKSGLNSYF